MSKINTKINNKLKYLFILIGIVFIVSIALPTLSRYKNRTSYYQVKEWDGSVASKYRSGNGSENNPYIISNGQEFAYFMENLKSTNYENVYFKLNNDIVLNKGKFSYSDGIKYTKDGKSTSLNSVNKINKVDTFSGYLDGNSFRIYGLYISSNDEEVSLFNNFNGTIKDLYIENSVISGGFITSGLSINTENATLENILYDGYIISSESDKIDEYSLEDITSTSSDVIEISGVNKDGNIVSSTLKGIFSKSEEVSEFKINGNSINEGEFSIDLGTNINNINYELIGSGSINLTNLKYQVISDYKISSGLIVNAKDTTLNKVINSTKIYSNYSSGFIYNSSGNVEIKNSYNKGNSNSNNSSGFIQNVNDTLNISTSYNTSNVTYSFINNIANNSTVNINSSFSIIDNYAINNLNESNLTINNSYLINDNSIKNGINNTMFNKISLSNLKSKSFIKETLGFKEFSDINDVNDNIWIINDDELPVLYIDDINSNVNINVSMFSWNNYSNVLNTIKFSSKFVFNITTNNEINRVKNMYYYISKSETPLTKSELNNISEWVEYSDIVKVDTKGNYIVYVKIVNDDDTVEYINTDILSIASNEPLLTVKINDKEYNNFSDNYEHRYLDSITKVNVSVNEEYTSLDNVSYYISDSILDDYALTNLEENKWIKYNTLNVDFDTNKIIYFRVLDFTNYYSYINTDYIKLSGYTQGDLTVGRNIISGNNLNITSNSSIKLNISYKDDSEFKDGYYHELVSNTKLPENTKITLIDNIKNKIYTYKLVDINYTDTNKNYEVYKLSNFTEVGTSNNEKLFNEKDYNGVLNESFDVIIDFSDTNITKNYYGVSFAMVIVDSNNTLLIPSIKDNIKKFNIYYEDKYKSDIVFDINYDKTINYNKDYLNVIPYTINIKQYDSDIKVYDSSKEDMRYGLELSLYNETTSTNMDRKYLRNVQFMLLNKSYHPRSNNLVNINLNNNSTGEINIETFSDNQYIEDGNYSFKICPYVSYDGENHSEIDNSKCKLIPLIMETKEEVDNNFDCVMNDENKIIFKNGVQTLDLNILQMSKLNNPNIRVSLYEKRELTAYNQSYKIVNISDYIDGNTDLFSENTIYLSRNARYSESYVNYKLKLNTDKLNYTAYKFVFELYDEDNLVSTVEENFIVKKGGS